MIVWFEAVSRALPHYWVLPNKLRETTLLLAYIGHGDRWGSACLLGWSNMGRRARVSSSEGAFTNSRPWIPAGERVGAPITPAHADSARPSQRPVAVALPSSRCLAESSRPLLSEARRAGQRGFLLILVVVVANLRNSSLPRTSHTVRKTAGCDRQSVRL